MGLGIDFADVTTDVSDMSVDVSSHGSHVTNMSADVTNMSPSANSHVTSSRMPTTSPITPTTTSHHMLATPPTTSSHVSHVTDSPSPDFTTLGHMTPTLTPTTPHHVTLPPIFFPTLSLTIGVWRRLSPQLSLAYYPASDIMTYHMTSEKTQFRMQFPFSAIDEIHVSRNPNDTLGALNLTLSQAPSFSIQTPKAPGRWVACHDFSEGKQASHVTTHVCSGPATVLQQQLSRVFALRSSHVRVQTGGSMHHVTQMSPSDHMTQMSPVPDHVTHVADVITADIASSFSIDTSNHMISSHVGDFPLAEVGHVTQPGHVSSSHDHVTDHMTSLDHVTAEQMTPAPSTNLTATILGNVTPGHTTPVLGEGFDLGHVTDLEQLVNVAHLLPNNHVTDEEMTNSSSCHMISSNPFTLDPSTPLSPFSGTLDYLEYY